MPSPSCRGRSHPGRPAHSSRTPAGPWSATLERLAAVLADGARRGGVALVGVATTAAGAVDLHLQPVTSGDLVTALHGWRAPPTWRAAGVTAPAGVAEAGRPAGSATVVLARPDGALVVAVAGGAGPRAWTTAPDAGEGRLADFCRRAMAAATPPCADPPRHAWAAPWLDRLVAAAAGGATERRQLRWPAVALAHPAAPLVAPGRVPTPDELVRGAALPLAGSSWDEVRRAVVDSHPAAMALAGAVTAARAAWHDGGSFARNLLARQPPPGELLDALADLLPPPLFTPVAAVAAAWDVVPPRPRPASDRRPTP